MNKRKLTCSKGHKKSLLKNLSKSLINHKKIKTTFAKAKELQLFFEKIVTISKSHSLHNKRLIISRLGGYCIEVIKLFIIADNYKTRSGGYTRILKTGFRKGDSAFMAFIELV